MLIDVYIEGIRAGDAQQRINPLNIDTLVEMSRFSPWEWIPLFHSITLRYFNYYYYDHFQLYLLIMALDC